MRPEKRQRRGERENANGRRRTFPLPATLDQLRANLLSSPPRDPRGPTLGAAPHGNKLEAEKMDKFLAGSKLYHN